MNNILLYSLFILGVLLSASFYTIGSYFFRLGQKRNIEFKHIYVLSIIFGLLSFIIKVPMFYYFGDKINVITINTIFLLTVFILVNLYSIFILNENIPLYKYCIFILIVLLIIISNILDNVLIHKK
jgi:hypothetical protein